MPLGRVWSRIDYILGLKNMLHLVTTCKIHQLNTNISPDHCMVSFALQIDLTSSIPTPSTIPDKLKYYLIPESINDKLYDTFVEKVDTELG